MPFTNSGAIPTSYETVASTSLLVMPPHPLMSSSPTSPNWASEPSTLHKMSSSTSGIVAAGSIVSLETSIRNRNSTLLHAQKGGTISRESGGSVGNGGAYFPRHTSEQQTNGNQHSALSGSGGTDDALELPLLEYQPQALNISIQYQVKKLYVSASHSLCLLSGMRSRRDWYLSNCVLDTGLCCLED
jgi:hypothetical protein